MLLLCIKRQTKSEIYKKLYNMNELLLLLY